MRASPSVRVSAARDLLAFAEKFETGARQKILDAMPRASFEMLESSPRTSWLDIEHDHWVVDGVVSVFGRERAIQCWRDGLPNMVDQPLLHGFVSGMLRLFGRDPSRVIALIPKGWPLVFRDFCSLRVNAGPGNRATLMLEDLSPEVRKYPNYFHSWDGILQGVLLVGRIDGKVDFTVSKDMTFAEATFSW